MTDTDPRQLKRNHLKLLSEHRKQLYQTPDLRQLFFELTLRCNEKCLHCGSGCDAAGGMELSAEQYRKILDGIKEDFDISRLQLCVTGGEPLLRKDFFDIMSYANELGFRWGMTSNGTLITKEVAHKLRECGMGTISVSIDGLRDSHDAFRQTPGGYDRAMSGIQNLIDEGGFRHIQVTSVISRSNMQELEPLYEIFRDMDIDSWRVIGIEPIGRAMEHPELLLTQKDQIALFDFIREKRMEAIPVTYGCSHYLGLKYEGEVRERYFTCSAGIYIASIMSNGDIGACLDIERRPELIYGNILKDRFRDVWFHRFEEFRKGLNERCEKCSDCDAAEFCAGGSHHSFDYDRNTQRICFKDVLF